MLPPPVPHPEDLPEASNMAAAPSLAGAPLPPPVALVQEPLPPPAAFDLASLPPPAPPNALPQQGSSEPSPALPPGPSAGVVMWDEPASTAMWDEPRPLTTEDAPPSTAMWDAPPPAASAAAGGATAHPATPWDPEPLTSVWGEPLATDAVPPPADVTPAFVPALDEFDVGGTGWSDASLSADDDRAEIEELIARAEAAAAAEGRETLPTGGPDIVDIARLAAAPPPPPAASSPPAATPDWLADLVGSIAESPADAATSAREAATASSAAKPAAGASAVPVSSDLFVTSTSTISTRKPARINGFAVGSFVAALLWVCGLGSAVAILFGVVALVQISSLHQRGKTLAFIGLALGTVGVTIALKLFFFNGGGPEAVGVQDQPPAAGELMVQSCTLDATSHGTAVVRLVNVNDTTLDYEITIAFASGDTRVLGVGERPDLAQGESDVVTVVTDETLPGAPDCTVQSVVRTEVQP